MWNTAALEMLMRLVGVEMLGIGHKGHRGRMGHRLVQGETLRMMVRLTELFSETGQVMVVQRMGMEPRPWLGETRADPPPPEPTESHTGEGRRIGRGCPRARRSTAASFCGGKRPRL